jgi:hypothetical protein
VDRHREPIDQRKLNSGSQEMRGPSAYFTCLVILQS